LNGHKIYGKIQNGGGEKMERTMDREAGLKQASDVLIDQVRAIDNSRFRKRLGVLDNPSIIKLRENLRLILD